MQESATSDEVTQAVSHALTLVALEAIWQGSPSLLPNRQTCLVCSCAAVKTRDPEAYRYPNRRWKTGFIGNDYRWLRDDGVGGRNLDARTLFFYIATVNTPAMALHIPGVGSQYAYTEHDSRGEYLDGAKQLPAHRPARRPRQGLLVGRRLRPPDPIRAPDRPGVPQPQQHTRPAGHERRRLDHAHLRTDRTRRQPRQLDPDRPRQEVVHHPSALRPARALVRQDLDPRRHRTAGRRLIH